MKSLCLQIMLLPKANTQETFACYTHKGNIYTTSPQKPILRLCQEHTRIFEVQKKMDTHMQYKAAKR